jgi:hypothetical protein
MAASTIPRRKLGSAATFGRREVLLRTEDPLQSEGGFDMSKPNIGSDEHRLVVSTALKMSAIIPFPQVRRRRFIVKTATRLANASPQTAEKLLTATLNQQRFDRDTARLLSMDADLAAKLRALAERVRRNVPLRRDPERFHIEKSCIAQDLEHLANRLDERATCSQKLTIERQRRTLSPHSAAQNYFK